MSGSSGASHPVWLLTRLKLRRLGNQLFTMFNRPLGRRSRSAPALARKSRARFVTSTALALIMFAGFTSMSIQALHNLELAFGTVMAPPPEVPWRPAS